MKSFVAAVLHYLGLLRLIRWINRRRLLVLTYHGVLPSASLAPGFLSRNVVTEEDFRWQMRYLTKAYHCLPLSKAAERLRAGEALPPYSAVVTFDDGFRNNYLYAFPILRAYGVPATIFLATGHVGQGTRPLWTERASLLIARTPKPGITLDVDGRRIDLVLGTEVERAWAARRLVRTMKGMSIEARDLVLRDLERQAAVPGGNGLPDQERYAFLDWDEVREMDRCGIEFGSHTVTHAILASLSDEQRQAEVVRSKEDIEEQLKHPCRLFAYPNGTPEDFDETDAANLEKAGYLCAVTQVPGFNDRGVHPYELRRLNIGRGHRGVLFVAQVSGLWPLLKMPVRPPGHERRTRTPRTA